MGTYMEREAPILLLLQEEAPSPSASSMSVDSNVDRFLDIHPVWLGAQSWEQGVYRSLSKSPTTGISLLCSELNYNGVDLKILMAL
jgi:hypothetical protein